MVKNLSSIEFQKEVLDAPGREIVEFYCASNPAGGRDSDALDKAAADMAGNTNFFRVDIDDEPVLGAQYAPDGPSAYVLFQDGIAFSTAQGPMTADQLIRMATDLEFGAD